MGSERTGVEGGDEPPELANPDPRNPRGDHLGRTQSLGQMIGSGWRRWNRSHGTTTATTTAPARPPRRAQREASQMTGSEGGQPPGPPGPPPRTPRERRARGVGRRHSGSH